MPLILRIDVDKPYGNNNLLRKVISKLREDHYFPALDSLGFLDQVTSFARLLHQNNIKGLFYFRNCTTPKTPLLQELIQAGHQIGFHAENTRSLTTFQNELSTFSSKIVIDNKPINIHSFSKHGSGYHKLGKNHYAPYEEDKYHQYAQSTGIPFLFGNGMLTDFNNLLTHKNFYPEVFWMEHEYRIAPDMTVENLVIKAQDQMVPVLIHPENYYNRPDTKNDFDKLLKLSVSEKLIWQTEL